MAVLLSGLVVAGVAFAADGRIAVADASNGRIQILDAAGLWLATWRVPEWRRDASSEPDAVERAIRTRVEPLLA